MHIFRITRIAVPVFTFLESGAGETCVKFFTFVMVWQYEKLLYCPRNNAKSIVSEEWQPKD
jgi:hypothetical protein